jgi:predicted PurR-regulated permease PerM
VRRVLTVFGVALAIGLVLWLVWLSFYVLMLILAGLLLAVLLRGTSDRLSRAAKIPAGWSLAVVSLGTLALVIFGVVQLAPELAAQIQQLINTIPVALQQLQASVEQYDWFQGLIAQLPQLSDLLQSGSLLAGATGVFSTTFNALLDGFIIVITGLYLAVDPRLYTHGVLRLVPMERRARAQEILSELGHTLWWWLLSRLVSMAVVGVMTGVGLWLLGVPLPLTLGLIAALLDFVPNVGPWLAAIPGVLLALLHSPQHALYAALLYFTIQQIEGYLITPIVQQRAINLPPVLTLFAQVLLTLTVGGIGLILASPLAAVVQVLVRMVYVEDVLGDRGADIEQEHAKQQDQSLAARTV